MCRHNSRLDESFCWRCCIKQMSVIDYDRLSVINEQIFVIDEYCGSQTVQPTTHKDIFYLKQEIVNE